jgi:hypothetical protein
MCIKIVSLFFLLIGIEAISQNNSLTLLRGKVVAETIELNGITVHNNRSESDAVTENNGNFSIFVMVGDTLSFSGLQINTKKVIISENDMAKKLFTIVLEPKIIPLNEVKIVEYKNINAVSLGILQTQPKRYTPAERRLRAAGEFHWYSPLLIPLGGMSVDGLINAITGRTKILKKELDIERKELALKDIENNFSEEYFITKLKIPKEYVKAFWYFAIEKEELTAALKEKNKIQTEFVFSKLATEFLELQKPENKK